MWHWDKKTYLLKAAEKLFTAAFYGDNAQVLCAGFVSYCFRLFDVFRLTNGA